MNHKLPDDLLDAEQQLSLLQHDTRQALDILARALVINEQVMRGEKIDHHA